MKENSKSSNKSSSAKATALQADTQDLNVVEANEDQYKGFISSLMDSKGFKSSWNSFRKDFVGHFGLLEEIQREEERLTGKLDGSRSGLLDHLRTIIPVIVQRLGGQGSTAKVIYSIAMGLEGVRGGSATNIRLLIAKYEEAYGDIYPKRLDDKRRNKQSVKAVSGNRVIINSNNFEGGFTSMQEFFGEVLDAMIHEEFVELDLILNAKNRIKAIELLRKDDNKKAADLKD